MTASSFLALEGITKRFGELEVLREISLQVAEGEMLALLGPSGSGKTTALRLLAGFETPNAGVIRVAGDDVTALSPARRGFGMVFQHYALFPHLDIAANVAFGLETLGWDRRRIAARVAEMLELVGLAGFETRSPGQVSGGQQQRVALARALAPEPRLLLLDEPLSNLDPSLRERTRRQLRRVVDQVGITTVLVTHEQEEAFHLGDRVAVLHDGVLQQCGAPEELYAKPATRFVATFIGRSAALPAVALETGGVRLEPPGAATGHSPVEWDLPTPGLTAGAAVEVLVRPESLAFAEPGAPGALAGRIMGRRFNGPVTYYEVRLGDPQGEAGEAGQELEVLADAGAAQEGDTVAVVLLPGALTPQVFLRSEDAAQ
ncbi:MAG: ABC transporter ATP-binding protein [Acidobacteriota bacterium]|nr:ABC transporter ATP-binding protein [Acidobacteriota bacterium]